MTSLEFLGIQLQPPLESIPTERPRTTIFIENKFNFHLTLVSPCGDVMNPSGARIGFLDAGLHDLPNGRDGSTCSQNVTLGPLEMVRANVHFHDIDTGLPTGDHTFTTVFGAVQVAGVDPIDPPAGMVSWWPGDGNASDIMDGNHGSLTGDFAAGMVGQAFSLDGTGDFVSVPDDPILTLGNGPFTIDLWVNFNQVKGRDPFIGHDEDSGELNKWIFWFDDQGHDKPPGPALRFHINSPTLPPLDPVFAPWMPNPGQWYHVAVTRTVDAYALYIDGIQVATGTNPNTIPDPNVPLTIGEAEGFFFDGLIDEVEIFNRALSDAEVRAIFEAGSAGKMKPEPASIVLNPVADGLVRDTVSGIKDGVPDTAIDDSVIQALDLPNFEDRGIAEFNISALPGTINSARFEFTVHGANGPFPFEVDLFGYSTTANGLVELNDWASGSLLNTFGYTGDQTIVSLDVATFLHGRVSAGDAHVGFSPNPPKDVLGDSH